MINYHSEHRLINVRICDCDMNDLSNEFMTEDEFTLNINEVITINSDPTIWIVTEIEWLVSDFSVINVKVMDYGEYISMVTTQDSTLGGDN